MPRKRSPIGSSFDSFLREEGLLADVVAAAAKQDLVEQFNRLRAKKRLTKAALAERAGISRMQLDRTMDPDNTSASLRSIARVAAALNVSVYFRLG